MQTCSSCVCWWTKKISENYLFLFDKLFTRNSQFLELITLASRVTQLSLLIGFQQWRSAVYIKDGLFRDTITKPTKITSRMMVRKSRKISV